MLLAAFERLTEDNPSLVIFDGHTIIEGAAGPIPIPAEVFSGIGCQRMIYLRAEPHVIFERRQQDQNRNRPQIELAEIGRHQDLAIAVSESICDTLAISLLIVDGSNHEAFAAALT